MDRKNIRTQTKRALSRIEHLRKVSLTDDPDPRRLKFSDGLRRKPTKNESILWAALRKLQKRWEVRIWRQTVIEGYILDFYFPDLSLGVELDGPFHDPEKDSRRDARLLHRGVRIIRFPNPTDKDDVRDIIFKVYSEVRFQKGRGLQRNPQKSGDSSLQGLLPESSHENKKTPPCIDERSGNLEKARRALISEGLVSANLSGKFLRTVEKGEGCQRQRYVSKEIAANMARNLEKLGIIATVETCPACRGIHIKELR